MIYTYDATGRKLTQQVFGSTPKTTDYINSSDIRTVDLGIECQLLLRQPLSLSGFANLISKFNEVFILFQAGQRYLYGYFNTTDYNTSFIRIRDN